MSKDEIHRHATATTPAAVQVPHSWAGIIVWAVGKWGVGAIFGAMLVWVYQDLQTANRAMVEVVRSNVAAIETIARQVRETSDTANRIEVELRYAKPK